MKPALRGQQTSEDRWLLREWLTGLADVNRMKRKSNGEKITDETGEPVYLAVKKNVPCFVDENRARIADTNQRISVLDVAILFKREEDIEIDDKLTNVRNLRDEVIFAAATITGPAPVRSPHRATLVKAFQCAKA